MIEKAVNRALAIADAHSGHFSGDGVSIVKDIHQERYRLRIGHLDRTVLEATLAETGFYLTELSHMDPHLTGIIDAEFERLDSNAKLRC